MDPCDVSDLRAWSLDRLLAALLPKRQAAALAGALHSGELGRAGFTGGLALSGVPTVARLRIAAAFELVRRERSRVRPVLTTIRTAADVVALVGDVLLAESVEVFRMLLLDGRHRVMAAPEVSRGTLTESLVHPREALRFAVLAQAGAVVAVHNHPSGEPDPSAQDDEVTRRLAAAGRLFGIPLLDHVVIGARGVFSYRERRPRCLDAPGVSDAWGTVASAARGPGDGASPMPTPLTATSRHDLDPATPSRRRAGPAAPPPALHFVVTCRGVVPLLTRGDVVVRTMTPLRTKEEGVARLGAAGALFPETPVPEALRPLARALVDYFEGEAVDPAQAEVALDYGTTAPFLIKVYDALRAIPRGSVISYGELARAVGSPGAARAVGQAMARNPLPLVVPCHRVLGSSGRLGGFSAPTGIALKRELLVLEGVLSPGISEGARG